MRIDDRITKLAENILKNSVKLKKGEKIYIEAFSESTKDLFNEFIRIATKMGAVPFYMYNDNSFVKNLVDNANPQQIEQYAKWHKSLMDDMDCYVAVRGYDDLFAMSDVSPAKMKTYNEIYYNLVHFDARIPNTRWCVMRYPNDTMAAVSKMSKKSLEDFFFDCCLVDYKKMGKAMQPLKKLMDKTDKVRIKGINTDLEFSIKDLKAVVCDGNMNIPDGEVYTAPVKNSINGYIQFNTDTLYGGVYYSNIYLEFEDGKIIKAESRANNDKLQKQLSVDEGAKYMGEFAIGVNPYIRKEMMDILFDEKIACSLHMAIGNSYSDETFNGNRSSVHWDLVLIQDKAHGGGEIWFDDKLIRKDGVFVVKELQGLNPDKLK
ncbi:MAG: aminopeptidase [Alphaproteobacteria bacterium]|nr:aminopeptidase [Alphaproteobacteria bacterium]